MNTQKIIEKYKTSENLKDFQNKLVKRFSKQKLVFGNKISIVTKNLIYNIDNILNNSDNFQECEYCNNIIFSGDITEVNGNLLCENCIAENYHTCENCGEYVYNDDIHILYECDIFCKYCYFIEKENIYKNHNIENILLKELQEKIIDITWDNIKDYEFKIDKNWFSLEKHNGFYRLGSWKANCWVDIGNKAKNILKAIDYNLGDNKILLTAIDNR